MIVHTNAPGVRRLAEDGSRPNRSVAAVVISRSELECLLGPLTDDPDHQPAT